MFALTLCVLALKYLSKEPVRRTPISEDPSRRRAPSSRVTASKSALRLAKTPRLTSRKFALGNSGGGTPLPLF